MALENKLGVSDDITLAHEEERISKRAALALYRDGSLDALELGTFATLVAIHEALFGEIYPFAGQVRTVNLAKGGFRFASALARGIDASYAYEGYAAFRAEELVHHP